MKVLKQDKEIFTVYQNKAKQHLKKFWTQSGIIIWAEYVGNSFHNISCFIVINREKNYFKMEQIIISKNEESMQSGQWMVWSGHLLASWSSFFQFVVWILMRYVWNMKSALLCLLIFYIISCIELFHHTSYFYS